MNHLTETGPRVGSWNKGKLVGQKAPLRLKDIWAIRIRLQLGTRIRELALFNLAIDSKLRSCDLVKLRVRDLWQHAAAAVSGDGYTANVLIHAVVMLRVSAK